VVRRWALANSFRALISASVNNNCCMASHVGSSSGSHGYTATALSFTVVNVYIEFKGSLKDTVGVTEEVSLLGGLLIGWGTSVSTALFSKQVQGCLRAWLYTTPLLVPHRGSHVWEIHLFAYGFYECSVFFMLITVNEYSIYSEVD